MREVAGVRALHTHDARVAAEPPVELTVADVHGVDLFRAVLQHTVGEAAGGRADVGADAVRERDGKRRHRLFELQPAAADIWTRAAAHLDCRSYVNFKAGLVGFLRIDIDLTCHDGGLCLASRLAQAELDKQNVQPLFMLHGV